MGGRGVFMGLDRVLVGFGRVLMAFLVVALAVVLGCQVMMLGCFFVVRFVCHFDCPVGNLPARSYSSFCEIVVAESQTFTSVARYS